MQENTKKTYIGKSAAAILNMFFMFAPYLFTVFFIIEGMMLFWLLLCLINSYTGIWTIGILIIDKEKINVKKNLAPKSLCFQQEINVDLKDIEFIKFAYITHDKYPIWTMPFMNLYLSNDKLVTINVFPYSKRQCIEIESNLIENNPNIIILKSAQETIYK